MIYRIAPLLSMRTLQSLICPCATLTNAQNVSLQFDANSLLIVPSGFDAANYFLNYNNAGLVHEPVRRAGHFIHL